MPEMPLSAAFPVALAVRTARPAAKPPFPPDKLLDSVTNPALTRLLLLCFDNPADELVARQYSDVKLGGAGVSVAARSSGRSWI